MNAFRFVEVYRYTHGPLAHAQRTNSWTSAAWSENKCAENTNENGFYFIEFLLRAKEPHIY